MSNPKYKSHGFAVRDVVHGGEGDDYDYGYIVAFTRRHGELGATVAWVGSGARTWAPFCLLRHEPKNENIVTAMRKHREECPEQYRS